MRIIVSVMIIIDVSIALCAVRAVVDPALRGAFGTLCVTSVL